MDVKGLRKPSWLFLVLSLMAVLLAGPVGCRSSVETKVTFLRDWDAAKEQAASDNKPIMINFYTDTWPWCTRLDADTFSDDEVSSYINEKLVAVKSNAGKSTLHKQYLTTTAVPQTVYTDASGAKIGVIVGYKPPAQFMEQMQSILAGYVSWCLNAVFSQSRHEKP
jgi:thioredoxin-related protein